MKPSLARVAVSAIYADGDRESKNMERDRNRHKHPSFRRRPNRPSASGALGFKRTMTILPDQSKNVNPCRLCPLDKPAKAGIIKITKGASTSGCPRLCYGNEKTRNRHLAEWRFRPLMRIVIVNPRIWKVNVIGIGTPPLQRIPEKNRPSLCWRPWGSKEPYSFYQTSRKMSIHAGFARLTNRRKLV